MPKDEFFPKDEKALQDLLTVLKTRGDVREITYRLTDGKLRVQWEHDDPPAKKKKRKPRKKPRKEREPPNAPTPTPSPTPNEVSGIVLGGSLNLSLSVRRDGTHECLIQRTDSGTVDDFKDELLGRGFTQTDAWKRPVPGQFAVMYGAYTVRFRWNDNKDEGGDKW